MAAANECVRAETPETDALAHVPCPEGELFHERLFKKYRDKARELELRLASVTKERDDMKHDLDRMYDSLNKEANARIDAERALSKYTDMDAAILEAMHELGAHEGEELLALAYRVNKELFDLRHLLDEAKRERDLAIAHDRQPYPTAHAYEQACKALDKWKARATQAERALSAARAQGMEDFRGRAMIRCEEMDRLYRSQGNHQHAAACAVMRAEIRKLPALGEPEGAGNG